MHFLLENLQYSSQLLLAIKSDARILQQLEQRILGHLSLPLLIGDLLLNLCHHLLQQLHHLLLRILSNLLLVRDRAVQLLSLLRGIGFQFVSV